MLLYCYGGHVLIIGSFLFFLFVFVLIGTASFWVNRGDNADYLLAGSSVKPWLVALSAVATNNSGYMFIGLIGYTYTSGLEAMWLMIGWILGDLAVSFFVHKKLRIATEETQALSFGGLLSKWNGTDFKYLRLLAGLITLAFLGTYAAAQLNAGSKALYTLFGWNYETGAIIGALIVVIYCFAGGIRASIWTDAAQSFVMFFAMLALCISSVNYSGGWEPFSAGLQQIDPDYLNIFPSDPMFGVTTFIIGWFIAGVGVIGQPHIMVRFMAMQDAEQMTRVRIYYYSWYSLFSVLAVSAGLAARLILEVDDSFDTELALPSLAMALLPDVLVGLVLAGLFAATMSTADSQILSCTAAITRDFSNGRKVPYWLTKFSTLGITATALVIALFGSDSVFVLVVFAWAALASAFGPLLIIYAFGGKPSQSLAIITVAAGVAAALGWRVLGYNDGIYEVAPGIVTGLLVCLVGLSIQKALSKREASS